jgi:hypothetical protein
MGGKLAVFAALLCLFIASFALYTARQWRARAQWVAVQGEILRVEPSGWWDEAAQVNRRLRYVYTVGGVVYQGERFHIKEDSLNDLPRYLKKLRPHQPVEIWINPEKPEEAALNREYLRDGFLLLTVCAGFIALAAAMLVKEREWDRLAQRMDKGLPEGYRGESPLPSSPLIKEDGGALILDTGMSVFWSMGIPFLIVCFAGVAWLALTTETLNPGWGLSAYFLRTGGVWLAGGALAAAVRYGVRHRLVIDPGRGEIREHKEVFGAVWERAESFANVAEIRLVQDTWRPDNPLRYWLFYVQTRPNTSWHILHRHRDAQPSRGKYLEALKARMDWLIFRGGRTA